MDNKNIVVQIDSIDNTRELMDSECDKLLSLINEYKNMFDETKSIYDTDSGTAYRTLAIDYLDMMESYIRNDFKEYINKLNGIKSMYQNEINDISIAIQGGQK